MMDLSSEGTDIPGTTPDNSGMALMATHASLLGVHHSKAMLPWYHFDRVISPNLHGCLNVQPMALERAQPSQHTMCRAVNERARLLLQFDGPLGLPKWPFRRALSTPSHLSRNKGQGGDAWFDGAEWAVFTI